MSTNHNDANSTQQRNTESNMSLTQSTSNFIDMIQEEMLYDEQTTEDEKKEKEIKIENILIPKQDQETFQKEDVENIKKSQIIPKNNNVTIESFESILNISFETENKENQEIIIEEEKKKEHFQVEEEVHLDQINPIEQKDSYEDIDFIEIPLNNKKIEKDSLEDLDFDKLSQNTFKTPLDKNEQNQTQLSDPSFTPIEENEVNVTQINIEVTQNPTLLSQIVKKTEVEGLTLSQIEEFQDENEEIQKQSEIQEESTNQVEENIEEPNKENIINETLEKKEEKIENQFFDEEEEEEKIEEEIIVQSVQIEEDDLIDSQIEKQLQELENQGQKIQEQNTTISEELYEEEEINEIKENMKLENSQPDERKEMIQQNGNEIRIEIVEKLPIEQKIGEDSYDIPPEFLEDSPVIIQNENLEKEKIIEIKQEKQPEKESFPKPEEKKIQIEGLDLDDLILTEDKQLIDKIQISQNEISKEIKIEKSETSIPKRISPSSQIQRSNKRKKDNGKFKKLKIQKIENQEIELKTPPKKDVKRKLENELIETNKKLKENEEIIQFETSQKEEVKEFNDTPENIEKPIENLEEYNLKYFGFTIYQRGHLYSTEGMIYSMDSEEIDEDIIKITSKCYGLNDNQYNQEIYLNSKHQILKTKCSCPIQKKCKHCCALIISYHESIKKGTPLKDSTISKLVQYQKKYDHLQNQYHHLLVQYIKTQKLLDRAKKKIKLKRVIDYNLDKEPYYVIFEE